MSLAVPDVPSSFGEDSSRHQVLIVDDEASVLLALKLRLESRYSVLTASCGAEALEIIENDPRIAILLSDMNMPGMDGAELLRKTRERAPTVVRMMLTASADQKVAKRAINEGRLFRFLTKPYTSDELYEAMEDAFEQYRLQRIEKDLLDSTVRGAMRVFADLLSIHHPRVLGESQALVPVMEDLARRLGLQERWDLEVATVLSRIGVVTIPMDVIGREQEGLDLTSEEADLFRNLPKLGADLIRNIPRLEGVADIVLYQSKCYDGAGYPTDGVAFDDIPLGARMLKVAADLHAALGEGLTREIALKRLAGRNGYYDPLILGALGGAVGATNRAAEVVEEDLPSTVSVRALDLKRGQVLCEDLKTKNGKLLLAAGTTLGAAHLARVLNYCRVGSVVEPVTVIDVQPRVRRPETQGS